MSGSMSGITVNGECEKTFRELQKDKAYKYILYHIGKDSEGTDQIQVLEKGALGSKHKDFVAQAKPDQSMWVAYDFYYIDKNGGPNSKIFFVQWNPDTANIKMKMKYSASKDGLKKVLAGYHKDFEANDYDEISEEAFFSRLTSEATAGQTEECATSK